MTGWIAVALIVPLVVIAASQRSVARWLVAAFLLPIVVVTAIVVVPMGLRWLKVRSGEPSLEALITKSEEAFRASDAKALVAMDHPDAEDATARAKKMVAECGRNPSSVEIEADPNMARIGRDYFLRVHCKPDGPEEGIRLGAQNIQGGGMTRYFLALGVIRDTDLGS